MAQQFFKRLALTTALVSLGFGMSAFGQTSPSTSPSSGSSASASKSGGSSANASKSSGSTGASATGNDAAKSSSSSKGGKSALDHSDRKFIEEAAKGGMAEVEMGQIAQQKAQNPQVKEFGGRMVQDHGKANDELKTLASSKGVQVPSELDRSHKKKADSLNKKSADKFDHEYMEEMVKDHKKDVKEFEKAAKNAKDADVRNFASKTLPTLQEHLKMAEAAQQAVKGGGKSSGKSASSGMSGSSSSGMSGSASATPTSGGAPAGSTGATGSKTK